MATFLNPEHMTLSEALELQRYDGSTAFVNELEKKSVLTQVMPWYPTSHGDLHKGVKATAIPEGKFGAINKAVPTGIASTKEYTETIKMFELKSDVDTRILEGTSPEKARAIRAGRDKLYTMGFMQSFANNVVTCDGKSDDSVKGLLPRRGKVDGKYTYTLGGASNVGSILLIRPGEDGVCFRYPSEAGVPNFTMKDMGIVQAFEKDSAGKIVGSFPAYETLLRLFYLIDVVDDEALQRIANVPTAAALTDDNIDSIIDVVNGLPNQGAGYIAFAPKKVIGQFWKYLNRKDNIAFSKNEVEGMGRPTSIFNVPFFEEEFMSANESVVG